MISRLTASAAVFAVLATAALGVTAEAEQRTAAQVVAISASTPVIVLPRVEITGKRLPRQ